ncbi:MAG: aminoacyl-tRNA hydrolase [Myxococcales bacterium]|nr:MAG: aminoacyl-tRNA hydrolase [Myxococcales bacterium]
MLLIAGLGNPGPRYQATRHNIGFRLVDELARQCGVPASAFRERFHGEIASARLGGAGGEELLLLRPHTFMNESGRSVQAACTFYKINPSQQLIVAHDELDLPFTDVRLKKGGGDGGNRGVRSVSGHLGPDYVRIRLGIGRPPPDFRGDPADFVLQAFASTEQAGVDQMLTRGAEAVSLVTSLGLEKAMNRINQRPPR